MTRLKRAVYAHARRMKALEKMCLADTEKSAQVLSNEELYAVKGSLPEWKDGVKYELDDIVLYNGKIYKCIQAHTAISSWVPSGTPTLWEVCIQGYEGTVRDPIPAEAGLRYFKDKYYLENGTLYLCIRDDTGEGTVLHHLPSTLTEDYFSAIK